MLQSLEILNGELSPTFDIYNNVYSVQVDDTVTSLDLKYNVESNYTVSVVGNQDFKEGENIVYIDVVGEESRTSYTLYVNKEKTETVSAFIESYTPVEVTSELPGYVAPVISIICFLIILFTYCLLFRKKKKVK